MRSAVRLRAARLLAAASLVALTALAASPLPVGAAAVTFGTPSATSSFGKGIVFTQPYSGGGQIGEVDVVIAYEGSFGVSVAQVEQPGSASFEYTLDTSKGQIQPNTKLVAHFQVIFADNSVQNGPDISITYLDDRFQWQTLAGKIVILHWYDGSDTFAQQALKIGEDGLANAAAFLGFTETAPVDFYVYSDQAAFYDALGPGTRDNVGGEANTQTRTLFALISPSELGYARSVVPHELTHVVFDDVTHNPYHFPPHWLNEGVAVYVSQGFDSSDRQMVSGAASDGTLMPLAAIRGQFPTTQDRFYLAYAESVSAVDYFVSTYGRADLDKLVKAFGTGASDDEAFKAAIGMSVDAFDKAWQKASGLTALKSFGPQAAPTGPLPKGWTTSGLTGGSSVSGPVGAPTGGAAAASGSPVAPGDQGGSSDGQPGGGIPAIVGILGGAGVLFGLVLVFVFLRPRRSRGLP
jgi:hypothetical protein